MANKIELKWYEKKQGINLKKKISAEQKKQDADEKQRRKLEEKNNSEKQLKQKKEKIERIQKQQKKNFTAERISSLFDPTGIPKDAAAIIEKFDDIVSSTHPLNSKQRALLPQQITALSHNLTDQRGDRRMGYMNETTALSAYVHYFLWWNLVRLVKLFSNLDKFFFDFKDDCIFVDIGSGPLTVPIALLLARPELRKKNVTFYCIDISQQALSFGEDIFLSVAARLETTTWKIIRVKGTLDTSVKDKADLVTCANMLNELHDDADMPPDFLAKKYTDRLVSFVDSKNAKARILSIEPGDPRSARLVSLMRDAFIRKKIHSCCSMLPLGNLSYGRKEGRQMVQLCIYRRQCPCRLKAHLRKSQPCKGKSSFVFCCRRTRRTKRRKSFFHHHEDCKRSN